MRDRARRVASSTSAVVHDADGLVARRFSASETSSTWVVERVLGAVGIDAERVHRGLVAARHVGRGGVGAVGRDRVGRRGADEGGIGHVVEIEAAVGLAVVHALRHQARGGAVGHAEAVGDHEDDVLRHRRRGAVDRPGDLGGVVAGLGLDDIVAGVLIVTPWTRMAEASTSGSFSMNSGLGAEHLLHRLAVDGDGDVPGLHDAGELDLGVEGRAGEEGARSSGNRMVAAGRRGRGRVEAASRKRIRRMGFALCGWSCGPATGRM